MILRIGRNFSERYAIKVLVMLLAVNTAERLVTILLRVAAATRIWFLSA